MGNTSQWKNRVGGALGYDASAEDDKADNGNHPKQSPHSGGLESAALGHALQLQGRGHAGLTVTAHFGVPANKKAAAVAASREGKESRLGWPFTLKMYRMVLSP